MDWLSEDWVRASGEALAASGRRPGGSSGLVAVETSGPDGGSYWREWEEGVPVGGGIGKPPRPADLTLTLSDEDARASWKGGWSPSVGFMRGRLKVAGDMAILLDLLGVTARSEFDGPRSVVMALTG